MAGLPEFNTPVILHYLKYDKELIGIGYRKKHGTGYTWKFLDSRVAGRGARNVVAWSEIGKLSRHTVEDSK